MPQDSLDPALHVGTTVIHSGASRLMDAHYESKDWAATSLGAESAWPQSLCNALATIRASRFPSVIFWGADLCVLYNDTYVPIFAAKHPDVLGKTGFEAWGEVWDVIEPMLRGVTERGESTWSENQLLVLERKGFPEECYFTWSYSPIRSEEGGVGGVLTTIMETTASVLSARRLRTLRVLGAERSPARTTSQVCVEALATLQANIADVPFASLYLPSPGGAPMLTASFGLEGRGQDTDASAAAARWRLNEVTREQLVLEARDAALDGLVCQPWPEPVRCVVVLPLRAAGQEPVAGWLVLGVSPRLAYDEDYASFFGLVASQLASVLAAARLQEAQRARAEELEALDRAKTAFFSNVSHEFRTPLTLMIGPTEDALASPERALSGAQLEAVHRNELRLLKLVNTLLEFTRSEAGRAEARFEPVQLAALTIDLASLFRAATERAGLVLRVDCPALSEEIFVDRDLWEKIVLNLLSNALKFTFDGEICVALRLVDDRVELEVRDTGCGVAPAQVPHLFERFHRVPVTRARTHEGSGIGLALVRDLARLHGGDVSVESVLERGTTFTVKIPRGSGHLPTNGTQPASDRAGGTSQRAAFVAEALSWTGERALERGVDEPVPTRSPTHRLLIADDNADMREYLSRILSSRFLVDTAADGHLALESARRAPPDLIVTDVMMPGLDGFGLLRALRQASTTSRIPVLMLSGRAGQEASLEGLEAGADDYMVKPFAARELLARVSTLIEKTQLRRVAERERQKLHDLFMRAPMAIAVLMGPTWEFVLANPWYCELVKRQDVVGRPWLDVFPELSEHPLRDTLQRVYEKGETVELREYEVALVRDGKSTRGYFDFTLQGLREEADGAGILVVAVEVTAQVVARQRIDRLRVVAEEASRAKDDFLSVLSHELRTPLSAIIGWASLLRRGAVRADQVPHALEAVERSARMQSRLIEDMLDLSRIEQGKLVISVGPVEMVRVVDAALDAVRPAADAKGVRIQPVLDSHATIVGDGDRLQQVVWNLVSNAIKFTPKGGRVQVRLKREPSYVEMAVADSGQGIASEFLPHVFERFKQADSSYTRQAGGLGLGLAIARSLVELHGGTIRVDSDGLGLGATFTVRLPMAPLRADQTSRSRVEPDDPAETSFDCPAILKGKSILVVDDERETRELLKFVVSQCECSVDTADGGEEALRKLAEGSYDLMISDVGMPSMDGFELITKVRAHDASFRHVAALALTAYARIEDRTRALKAGFDVHLAKPIDPGELVAVLASLLTSRGRR